MFNSEESEEFLKRRNVDANSTKWAAKRVPAMIIYCLLLVFYVPFFLLSAFTWGKMIFSIKAKQYFGKEKENDHGKLGIASRRHKVQDMSEVSPADELDFLVNRSYGYLHRMCFWTPKELTLFFLKEQNIKIISDGQLSYVVLCTVFGQSVRWNEERQMFHLTMEGLGDIQLFEGFFWDAREILISPDGKKIIIKMYGGEEFHSDCSPEQRPTFELAKLHTQICLSFMGPGLSHNEVHFLFPSAMAVLSKKHLNREGVLFKLLAPHFRFTERINYQALRVQKATNNKRSKLDRLFFHWQPFPVTKEIFREAIAKKCKEYYLEKGSEECQLEENEFFEAKEENESLENDVDMVPNGNGSTNHHGPTKKTESGRTHKLFPPDYITDKNLLKVPYLNFLHQYYKVIRRYVENLAPFIDEEEWATLNKEVAKYVPRFEKVSMVEALSSYIHKVAVVHFCDHGSYTRYFAYPYACMSMRVPFEPLENQEAWADLKEEFKVDPDAVKRDPLSLITPQDVLRTRCFLNIFVDFIGNPDCNLFLPDTEYNFKEYVPQMAARKFKEDLRTLDEELRMQPIPLSIPEAEQGEVRSEGMQLEPLEEIVRTVCY